MKKLDRYIGLLHETLKCLNVELEIIRNGKPSEWEEAQIVDVVLPEVNYLLSSATKKKVLFKYGKRQRMLESTYLITDSLSSLNQTTLGQKILELQQLYNLI